MVLMITHGVSTVIPTQILGYETERESQNIVHAIMGRSEPDVTLRPAYLRTGTLSLGFEGVTSETDSKAAEDLHATGGVFTLNADRVTAGMSYVVTGTVKRTLEEETRDAWIVEFSFQEVSV